MLSVEAEDVFGKRGLGVLYFLVLEASLLENILKNVFAKLYCFCFGFCSSCLLRENREEKHERADPSCQSYKEKGEQERVFS